MGESAVVRMTHRLSSLPCARCLNGVRALAGSASVLRVLDASGRQDVPLLLENLRLEYEVVVCALVLRP